MKKFSVICADPPWEFSDGLKMEAVKRGAGSQYDELNIEAIKNLPVQKIAADDSVLVLWVPGSFLQEGLDTMKAWGFDQKQIHVWVKTKKNPLESLLKYIKAPTKKAFNASNNKLAMMQELALYTKSLLLGAKIDHILAFGMGRLFRQTHEIALVGTRGKVYGNLKNKSQRSVHFGPVLKHSAKPETIQDMLETMFPAGNKIELFARRSRKGWTCLGNQCPDTEGEDIRDSLKNLMTKKESEEHKTEIQETQALCSKYGLLIKQSKDFTKEERKYLLKRLR